MRFGSVLRVSKDDLNQMLADEIAASVPARSLLLPDTVEWFVLLGVAFRDAGDDPRHRIFTGRPWMRVGPMKAARHV